MVWCGAPSTTIFHCHAIGICNIYTNPPLHPILLSHYSTTQASMEVNNGSDICADGCATSELQGDNREVSTAHFYFQE